MPGPFRRISNAATRVPTPGRRRRAQELPGHDRSLLVRLLVLVVGLLVFQALLQAYFIKPFTIPSASMEPTLMQGDRIFTNRLSLHFIEPARGDIIVFHPPLGAEAARCPTVRVGQPCPVALDDADDDYFVKRVVGLPGDRISFRGGTTFVDGRPLREPWARVGPCPLCDLPEPMTVPDGTVYAVGDNRANSLDSRAWGPVRDRWVIGIARVRYWPLSRWQLLDVPEASVEPSPPSTTAPGTTGRLLPNRP